MNFDFQLNELDYAVLSINLILFLFARRILTLVYHDPAKTAGFARRVMVFRALNILIVIAFGYYHLYLPATGKTLWFKLLSILVTLYLSYVTMHILHYLILKRYGKQREINGRKQLIATYQTRLLNIFTSLFIFIVALISIIRLLGFESMLEAGGVIGFIGVFLALTQSTWAPDIFSGLIILNSDMMEEGDVIEIRGESIYGTIYKTKVFHTEILNLINNHRIMIRNARLREFTVHNLSKFASAKGLREKLLFKIGYDTEPQKVRAMFDEAFDMAVNQERLPLESQHGFQCFTNDAGDHAIEWIIYYYTKEVDRLPWLRQQMIEICLKASRHYGISLATPLTHEVLITAQDNTPH